MKGFVLLARQIQDNKIWRKDPDHLKLFLYLLMNANYQRDKIYQFDDVSVGYGEVLKSYRKISEDNEYSSGNKIVRWSTSRISRMLKALKDDGRISYKSTKLGTVVEITNMAVWQDFQTYKTKKTSRSGTTSPQHKTEQPDKQIKELWEVYLEELGGKGKQPTLTAKRKQVIGSLYDEQLKGEENYTEAFRGILKAVKSNEFYQKRAYQLPESLFKNPERRERHFLNGIEHSRHQHQAHGVSRSTWSVDL